MFASSSTGPKPLLLGWFLKMTFISGRFFIDGMVRILSPDTSSLFPKGLVLAGTTAQLLPRNAAEALLRSNEFDVQAPCHWMFFPTQKKRQKMERRFSANSQAAASAFRASPREALDLAGFLIGKRNEDHGYLQKKQHPVM